VSLRGIGVTAWPLADGRDLRDEIILDQLREVWLGIYDVGYADGAYRAVRVLADGPLLTADNAEGLDSLIRADWVRWGRECP
jgi:hypothetical protein